MNRLFAWLKREPKPPSLKYPDSLYDPEDITADMSATTINSIADEIEFTKIPDGSCEYCDQRNNTDALCCEFCGAPLPEPPPKQSRWNNLLFGIPTLESSASVCFETYKAPTPQPAPPEPQEVTK